MRLLAKGLDHGKSVAEVRELVRRQQLLTVADEEPGLRCVIRGDAMGVLSESGWAPPLAPAKLAAQAYLIAGHIKEQVG